MPPREERQYPCFAYMWDCLQAQQSREILPSRDTTTLSASFCRLWRKYKHEDFQERGCYWGIRIHGRPTVLLHCRICMNPCNLSATRNNSVSLEGMCGIKSFMIFRSEKRTLRNEGILSQQTSLQPNMMLHSKIICNVWRNSLRGFHGKHAERLVKAFWSVFVCCLVSCLLFLGLFNENNASACVQSEIFSFRL